MSDGPPFFVAPTAALADERLNRAELKVLFALCSFYNRKTKRCFPSRGSLADRAGLSRSRTGDALRRLEAYGWIIRIHDFNELTGAQRSNEYELRLGESFLESFTPVPDISAPPLPDRVAPPHQAYEHPPHQAYRQQGAGQGGTKQRTELRSELATEPRTENTAATASRLTASDEQKRRDPSWWKDPARKPAWAVSADAS